MEDGKYTRDQILKELYRRLDYCLKYRILIPVHWYQIPVYPPVEVNTRPSIQFDFGDSKILMSYKSHLKSHLSDCITIQLVRDDHIYKTIHIP